MLKHLPILLAVSGSASAQDTIFTVEFDVTTDTGEIRAEYFGDLPGATTSIGTVWSDTSFELRADGAFNINTGDNNPGYFSDIIDGPAITGQSTDRLTFVGVQAIPPLGAPDTSNPLRVTGFSYDGSASSLEMELFGQNSALFVGDPSDPFGTILLYVTVDPPAGVHPLTWRVDVLIVPVPGTLSFASMAIVAATRRRKVAAS